MITARRKIEWKERKRETTTSVDGRHQGMDETVLCRMCRIGRLTTENNDAP